MPQVVAAQRSLEDAQNNVAQATKQLSYEQQQAKLHIDAANQSMKQASSQANTYQQALAALTPAQRQFVQFLIPIKDRLQALQQVAAKNLFPGLERGIKAALKNLPTFKKSSAETAQALGKLGARTSGSSSARTSSRTSRR
jgi:DNA repair exonuclease SbcCD ATPase subunit